MEWKKRYFEAYKKYQDKFFPSVVKDQGYMVPKYPKVDTANGLTAAVCNYLKWEGHYANRINTMGRPVVHERQQVNGTFRELRWQRGTTNKGTADIDSIIAGKPVKFEVKIGSDRQSDAQKKEQQRIERAGGSYYIIKTVEDFFTIYDSL